MPLHVMATLGCFLSEELKLACMGTWENKMAKPHWINVFKVLIIKSLDAVMLQLQSKVSLLLTSVFCCLSPKFSSRITFSMPCLHFNDFPGYFKIKSLQWISLSCHFLVKNLCVAPKQRFGPCWSTLLEENRCACWQTWIQVFSCDD